MLKNLTKLSFTLLLMVACVATHAQPSGVKSAKKSGSTVVEINFENGECMMLDFYGKNIFRLFQDNEWACGRTPA